MSSLRPPTGAFIHQASRIASCAAASKVLWELWPMYRRLLHELAKTFDRMPKPEIGLDRRGSLQRDEFAPGRCLQRRSELARSAYSARSVLGLPARRSRILAPSRKAPGVSATTNFADSNLLYVFTSSTEFEPDALTPSSRHTHYWSTTVTLGSPPRLWLHGVTQAPQHLMTASVSMLLSKRMSSRLFRSTGSSESWPRS